MSALARLLNFQGAEIIGSDSAESALTKTLVSEGITVIIGQKEENLPSNTDCVIYSLAISKNNPEFIKAKEIGLPMFTYAQMLGQVSAGIKTIAVAGTHGKTTTTAMLNSVMRGAGFNPSMIVGSILIEPKTNFIAGNRNNDKNSNFNEDIFIVEACEYGRSFLNLHPEILIITNIEEDHLDYYKDLSDIKSAFMEMASRVADSGKIICDTSDENLAEIVNKYPAKVVDYTKFLEEVPQLVVIGDHNRLNAAAALAAGSLFFENEDQSGGAKKSLARFRGTWRRLEFHEKNKNGALLYDDYAHHPSEIEATLTALKKEFPDRKIIAFFQPHLYSRTKIFLNGFVKSLALADEVFILPIYAAREPNDPEISSQILVDRISGAKLLKNFEEASIEIEARGNGDLVVTLGAGDIADVLITPSCFLLL